MFWSLLRGLPWFRNLCLPRRSLCSSSRHYRLFVKREERCGYRVVRNRNQVQNASVEKEEEKALIRAVM